MEDVMTAGRVQSSDLDSYVAECDRLGGPQHPNCAAFLSDFNLVLETNVDQTLDPFSHQYFKQQLAVYREMSGRDLDQEVGEQAAVDVETNSMSANPVNSCDIKNISLHTKTIATLLSLANIPPHAKILDLGAGWGLSSEIMAFCGARVTAVDINPLFVDLITRRAVRKNLPISARLSNFDDFLDEGRYDLAVFYECLHHAVKPWETLQHIALHLNPNGKFAIAGEPIVDYWQHWGIRTDCLSAYCVRKFGWFESGWSRDFITRAFERAGFELQLTPHRGAGSGYIGIAHRIGAEDRVELEAQNIESLIAQNQQLAAQLEYLTVHNRHMQARLETKVGNALRNTLRPAKRLYEKMA
ncbi:2-polyprenyl-3-methyl-5-hydroxy-6-metoxy-1,4-benzoquinol methylase [Phyllobacterium sp. 1468]|uniref:class I SAM-dependent methyltransferase n=1 Tax=Phyllobacterium sp. 1468 TaxID=2817759 RepID=UPI0028624501|nr:class I SAM-dependent methyltransferase [Phyllobacterium sp. 1468]MDR6635015.1 2-polyprenyl-3-methyl-5-hydroxy-6-metoxy-1,4-benzoquinol methylase [Phyllobacterium sp. 1468]